jgi:hypothetical protein
VHRDEPLDLLGALDAEHRHGARLHEREAQRGGVEFADLTVLDRRKCHDGCHDRSAIAARQAQPAHSERRSADVRGRS